MSIIRKRFLPAGGTPFPHITSAIEQTKGADTGRINSHRRAGADLLIAFPGVQPAGLKFVAPGIHAPVNTPGPFLPLGFGGQAIQLAGFRTQPPAISHAFIPAQPNRGLVGFVKASILPKTRFVLLLAHLLPTRLCPKAFVLVTTGLDKPLILGVGDRIFTQLIIG